MEVGGRADARADERDTPSHCEGTSEEDVPCIPFACFNDSNGGTRTGEPMQAARFFCRSLALIGNFVQSRIAWGRRVEEKLKSRSVN